MVHHNGYWCTKCTERRICTQDEATPKPTRGRRDRRAEEKAKEEKVEREKEERAEGSILPRAEDGGADADNGGAVADG